MKVIINVFVAVNIYIADKLLFKYIEEEAQKALGHYHTW
jgi:hypothetical protein